MHMEDQYGTDSIRDTEEFQEKASQVKERVRSAKEKVTQQADSLKERWNAQADQWGNQFNRGIDTARGKTSAGLRTTSQRIQNLAVYMEEHDAQHMSETAVRSSREFVRKHPGRSLLFGMLAGLLLGRALLRR